MKKLRNLFITLIAVCMAVSAVPVLAFAGSLTYEGSTTIGENIMPEAAKAFEAKAGIKFASIGGLGSGKGFKAMMEGKVNIAGVSRSLTTDEKKLKPYSQTIGYDAIAVFVNEKNTVKNLTKEQIKGIFTGKIKNWKEVGGKDAKIFVITEILTGDRATIKAFRELALDDAAIYTDKEIDKPHDCAKAVAADANAISHASLAFAEPGIKAISVGSIEPTNANVRSGAYLLSRPLLLVTKELPSGDLKDFFGFILSPEGQAIVKKNFVPVK